MVATMAPSLPSILRHRMLDRQLVRATSVLKL